MRLSLYFFFYFQQILTQKTVEYSVVHKYSFIGPLTITKTITFQNTFSKVPQIIIQIFNMSLDKQNNEVDFEIISVTLTNFEYRINFPFNVYVGRYIFKWLAIVEDRIQVINIPRETVLTNGSIYTYSHSLSQVTQAVIILNGFGYVSGGLNFELQVFSISSTNVKIQLLTTNTNIKSISYQIILGTKDAFYATKVQKTGGGTSLLGEFTVQILQDSLLYQPLNGINWDGSTIFGILISSSIISSDYQCTYSSFENSNLNSVTIQSVQFFPQILSPYYAQKYHVSKQFVEFPTQQILVKFIELNQSFNSDTLQTFNLLLTQTQLNVQIEIALSSGKKLQGYFLKCNLCGDNNKHIINQAYYYQGSFIKFRIQLLQYTNVASKLVFSIISNKILLSQVTNQAVDIYDIILLEIIDA